MFVLFLIIAICIFVLLKTPNLINMKLKIFYISAFVILLVSCNSDVKKEEGQKGNPEMEDVDAPVQDTEEAKKVTDRNYSVTKDNAYNDMFLDSLAMERYISKRQLADKKIARRIRSFYNARNYQYAWFSTNGLTEQSRFFWNQY